MSRFDWFGHTPPEAGPFEARLWHALHGVDKGATGAGDLAALFRQLLRQQRLSEPLAPEPSILVPTDTAWPTTSQWRRHSVRAVSEAGARLRIRTDEWLPSQWLD